MTKTKPFDMKKWKRLKKQQAMIDREFIAWDGEGINRWEKDGVKFQDYAMLSNSLGERMIAPESESLERVKILEWIINTAQEHKNAIHVFFGANYDFNMVIRGNAPADYDEMVRLKEREEIRIGSYHVTIMWGRMLEIDDGKGTNVKVYDIMPFFQCSFVKACDDYLGEDWPGRDLIIRMKNERTTFEYSEMELINEYNDYELRTLVLLANELRTRLFAVGLRISHWYGPGAIASFIYKQQRIKYAMDQLHTINDGDFGAATRQAYAGGRFEVIQTGFNIENPIYEYDINSAYPRAMLELPNLATGKWSTHLEDPGYHHFALYHITYSAPGAEDNPQWHTPFPLYHRSKQSLIFYPPWVEGWFWSPEYAIAKEYVAEQGGSIIIDKAYVYHDDGSRPFAFVQSMYDKRMELKEQESGAQIGLKLALNSLYGKMCQQVGWKEDKLPPYHQLEWAGYVTSYTRAMLMRASMANLSNVVAFATDAVFSTCELPVREGRGLGEWEAIEFRHLSMLQSGIYFGEIDGEFVNRSRGIRMDQFNEAALTRGITAGEHFRDTILNGLRNGIMELTTHSQRFVGLGAALARNKPELWCNWVDHHATISLMLTTPSKRTHARANIDESPEHKWFVCPSCTPDHMYQEGTLHFAYVPPLEHTENKEHMIEWIHDDEYSQEISLERESDYQIMEYGDI